MKRKLFVTWMAFCMMISMVACGNRKAFVTNENTVTEGVEKTESKTELARADKESDASKKDNTDSEHETPNVGLDELEELVMADVEGTIGAISEEYESLLTALDAYEKYLENTDTMEAFYEKVYTETRSMCIGLRDYSVEYANVILASDKSFEEKYEDFKEMYDCIYEDASEEIFDEVYNGILDESFDDFYNGVLKDAYENAEYKEWSEARSKEYEWWSDCRSDVYDEWSDCRSDVYDFWSDMRGEMWDDDMEKAYDKINDFVEDIEKLKSKSSEETDDSTENADEITSDKEDDNTSEETAGDDAELVDGMRPEFKEAMDSYETFYEEYCDVMKKYNSNPTDATILTEYTELLQQSVKVSEAFEAWDEGEMNNAELKYYLEVSSRVTQMLLEVSGR